MNKVPKSHPRYLSLITRERIVDGVEKGITSKHGLIAQGRGEAWDYLISEKTNDFAKTAIDAACAFLILAKHPVISVNGNVAALAPEDIINLSLSIPAKIEVNIFHTSKKREQAIKNQLLKSGAKEVLMPSKKCQIRFIDHNRKYVNKDGILNADVVFVPLEDGDRCEALIKNGKKVIAVDLNPLSRTAKKATVTIVDNIVRCISVMNKQIPLMKKKSRKELNKIIDNYDNRKILKQAKQKIRQYLSK
jgi:4-phosphopantoate---beta-alanine ligase